MDEFIRRFAELDVGSVAICRDGDWQVALDGSLDEPRRWFLEIEGPNAYVYSELRALSAVKELATLFESKTRDSATDREEHAWLGDEIELIRDDESPTRVFLITKTPSAINRLTFADQDYESLATCFWQLELEVRRELGHD